MPPKKPMARRAHHSDELLVAMCSFITEFEQAKIETAKKIARIPDFITHAGEVVRLHRERDDQIAITNAIIVGRVLETALAQPRWFG